MQRFDDAIDLRYREVELEARVSELREGWNETANRPKVTTEDIAEVVAMWTGVPVSRIAGEERERLLEMERVMHQRIIGQDEPIKAIAKAVRRARAGLKDPEAAHRQLHVPGADRHRQDAAGQDAGRIYVRQRGKR
jgi:ATP-dependent Clp protease ATP-binding subunit ClpC